MGVVRARDVWESKMRAEDDPAILANEIDRWFNDMLLDCGRHSALHCDECGLIMYRIDGAEAGSEAEAKGLSELLVHMEMDAELDRFRAEA